MPTFGKGIVDAGQSGSRGKRIKKAEKAKKEAKDVAAVTTGWINTVLEEQWCDPSRFTVRSFHSADGQPMADANLADY